MVVISDIRKIKPFISLYLLYLLYLYIFFMYSLIKYFYLSKIFKVVVTVLLCISSFSYNKFHLFLTSLCNITPVG